MGGIGRIVGALTGRQTEAEAELVFWLNGLVALALGVSTWIEFDFSFGAAAAATGGLFLLSLLSLLNVYTAIASAFVGSLVAGAIGGLLGASFGFRYGGTAGAWIGGIVAGAGLLAVAVSSYRKIVRAVLSARQHPEG